MIKVTVLASGGNRPEKHSQSQSSLSNMKSKLKRITLNTRAYPSSDVCDDSDANASKEDHTRAYPVSDVQDDKNKSDYSHLANNRLRFATWNLGSLTGRSNELAKILQTRNINVCCIQETKWKGSKSRELGMGYQLIYHGLDSKRNGVAIILDYNLKQRLINVNRVSDRIIAIKLVMDNQSYINVLSVYAPQSGSTDAEKTIFWDDLDDLLNSIPANEVKYIGGDLNGHVGKSTGAYIGIHGGHGYGTLSRDGERILDFCAQHNLVITNTYFQKKTAHLVTYKSGGKQTQIDYILTDRKLLSTTKDCKVIPGESLTAQHRILVSIFQLPKPVKSIIDKTPRIKWRMLHGERGDKLVDRVQAFLAKDMVSFENNININTIWNNFEEIVTREAGKILGISKGQLLNRKDPTWWKNEVKDVLSTKKKQFKVWQHSGLEEDREKYKRAKKEAKRKVAQSIAEQNDIYYSRLENAKDDVEIFKIAKQRNRNSLDVKINKYIKDEAGHLLTSNDSINNRWFQYYDQLLNEEFPKKPLKEHPRVSGPVQKISIEEVAQAVTKMKRNKATGPDGIPADLWKKLAQIGIQWLTKLFNVILDTSTIPNAWRRSYIIPFYKNKGDVSECSNYRGIKLMSHTLKIWERVINNRLCKLVTISENQHGFRAAKSTIDAIQTVRITMEKHRSNGDNLHLVFIDLEKAFDRVPRTLVWQAMRSQGIPEYYISLVQDMYDRVSTQVKSRAGLTKPFEVKVGVHQGSTLSPFLFNLVMDYLTKDIQSPLPWCLLYADDIVLMDSDPNNLQDTLQKWRLALENNGLRISRSKTEFLECNFSVKQSSDTPITLETESVPKVQKFKYLGSVLSSDATVDEDVTHRVNAAWLRWRALSGVLCDKRMPIKTKGKVYKTAVRPAMLYGAECWATKKTHEQKLHVNEMKMLRWAAGVTRLDKVRNEYIRGSFKVAPITDKMVESRLRWYGHVMRRNEDHAVRRALALPEIKKGRGRPAATWWTTVAKEIENNLLAKETTQDRLSWRRMTRRADPK